MNQELLPLQYVDVSGALPVGWQVVPLGRISTIQSGVAKDSKKRGEGYREVPYLRVANVQRGWLDLDEVKTILAPEEKIQQTLLRPGDVLFNEGGDRDKLGRGWVWGGEIKECIHQNHVFRARMLCGILPKYISYYGNSWGRDYFISGGKQTTNLASINQSMLKALPIRLAPLPEQRRIVAEIEKQFTRLDAAVATLKRVQANLERARASVLKAAVEGRLVPTEAELARAEGRVYEPASVLLERILEERERKHDEAQAGATRKKKYKPPVAPDLDGLPDLPEGWTWASVDQVLENHDGSRVPIRRDDRMGRQGEFLYYGASGPIDNIDDYTHEGSYLLVGEDGANLLTRSKPIAFQAHGRFWVNNHAHVLLPYCSMPLGYFEAHFNSMNIARYVTGSAQPKLPQGAMNKIALALPPVAEQSRIVAELERRLSVLHQLEELVVRNLQRCERLRQSILKRAFEGKLVPQDPNDEPASELLARIQANNPA